ncbi:lysine N(6)-hydroxylase/L-ornithine N(5)-oxygenase family protein [Thermobifida halotolerans]|uniref:lysine N(6)-hydroxylase/L-ornithine N(5)-oxygenase family protein n=1 Tax=Thermobifida halotolerans TaxID=483545 RepID=UPI0008392BFF|nr:SidA/IucD/PvdA family monooxygenase [Thermobifida halotolerans]
MAGTHHSATGADARVHDLVGVGFGPSNLGLAIALRERRADGRSRIGGVFLERQERFGWHRGMLLDDATMQISFLKDLVTPRNPASDFTFLAYLRQVGRLHDFINHKTLFPLRTEFHDYLSWCAERVGEQVRYGREVVALRPVRTGGRITRVDVVSRDADGRETVERARNVVLAPGLRPSLPEGVRVSERIWHSEYLLHRLAVLPEAPTRGFVVVGAGQSAAEVVDHLHRRFPDVPVHAVFSRYGYSPSDDTPFANRIFDPEAVDAFYDSPPEFKDELMGYHRNTNYSVVDPDLITDLYRRVYAERANGTHRLRMHNMTRVVDLAETDAGVDVTVEHRPTGKQSVLRADHVVHATGYRPVDVRPLLGELAGHCVFDDRGRPVLQRDYRVVTDDEVTCGLYLQGGTEHTHGISSSLLSNVAVRAAEILDSVEARHEAPVPSA